MTSLDLEIRSQLARVLTRETSLRDFYEWFVPATWEVEQSANDEAIRLTYQIAHLLNNFSADDISAEDVEGQLSSLAATYVLTNSPWSDRTDIAVTTGTDLTTESERVHGFVFGTPREAVFS
jgi:hypothetical protein